MVSSFTLSYNSDRITCLGDVDTWMLRHQVILQHRLSFSSNNWLVLSTTLLTIPWACPCLLFLHKLNKSSGFLFGLPWHVVHGPALATWPLVDHHCSLESPQREKLPRFMAKPHFEGV